MPPTAKKTSKPIFKTSAPFTETQWPTISLHDQDVILDLVCNLLQPLGDHRRTHIHPSKGKRRKRKNKPLAPSPNNHQAPQEPQDPTANNNATDTLMEDADAPPPPPSQPEIVSHVLVGLNRVTRHLEALAAKTAPSTLQTPRNHEGEDENEKSEKKQNVQKEKPLSIVLLTHPNPPSSAAHAHLPTLIHLSSLSLSSPYGSLIPSSSSSPSSTNTRLIVLRTSSESRLASALHIPRVGAIGILEGAPGAKALEDYAQEKVSTTECKWLDEAARAEWKGIGVDVLPSKAGQK